MSTEKLRPAFTFTEERLKELQSVVPEAFADGRVNWDTLREALGETLDDEGASVEHFGLNWPGKREARRLAAKPSHGTLLPAPGEGVNEETTGHLFLEGDNLEVLKLLQKSYAGRVKMIYIDPPYNTGNDFVYRDDFSEPLESYLERSGQTGEKGELLTTNPKASGRFHSNWLNMIYPRLRLARTLLRDDGVIFVSIDDNEVHHLRSVMDEVFGEENFVGCFLWQKSYSPRMDAKGVSPDHDFILAYAATDEFSTSKRSVEQNAKQFTGFDAEKKLKYRPRSLRKEGKGSLRSDRPNLFYAVNAPDGTEVFPIKPDGTQGRWRVQKSTYELMVSDGVIEWAQTKGEWQVFVKQYLSDEASRPYTTIWPHLEVGHNHEAVDEVKSLIKSGVFDNPKPTRLLKRMMQVADTKYDDLILDFFSGSATTAHAVLQLNHEDSGNRQFILVQLPEKTPAKSAAREAGFETIADIGKERIRRAIAKIAEQPPLPTRDTPEDLGFRVLKLASSHFKQWREAEGQDLDTLGSLFDDFETPLCEGWTPAGLLSETLLLEGFPLDSTVESADVATNAVQRVTSPACGHALLVCFDASIDPDILQVLALDTQNVFVCLDSALSDDLKLRLNQTCTLKTI